MRRQRRLRACRAQEEEQNGADVAHPGHCLKESGLGGEVQGPLEQRGIPGARVEDPGNVEGKGVQSRDDARFLEVVDAVGEDSAGDDHEHCAGPAEELGEVDAQGAPVEEPAEQDRQGEPDDPTEERHGVAGSRGLGGGVEEDRGLKPFPANTEEADKCDGERAEVQGPVELPLEFAGERASG